MASSYTHTTTSGNTTTSTKYTCDKKALQYTVIGDDIKADFDFLLPAGGIANKLDEMLNNLKQACDITDGFYFENGSSVWDLAHVYSEIVTDVADLKSALSTLHSAFMTDIDNVNAELEVNFGHWVGYKVNAGKTTTTTTNP